MKTMLSIGLIMMNLAAYAGTEIEVNDSFARLSGSAAKEIYQGLTKIKAKNNQGEAGPDVYFKSGKTFRCHFTVSEKAYACDILLN